MKFIPSFSGGKDSTAMLHVMLKARMPIHSVVYFDTGWEFPHMLDHLTEVEKRTGIEIIRVKFHTTFDDLLPRYGWPSWNRRWCTERKIRTIKQYAKKHDAVECIGFAYDEIKRLNATVLSRPAYFPLIARKITEADALKMCYKIGYTWGGLYEHFNRVSCYCCPLQRKGELRKIKEFYPEIWSRMLTMGATLPAPKNRFGDYDTLAEKDKEFSLALKQRSLALHITRKVQN